MSVFLFVFILHLFAPVEVKAQHGLHDQRHIYDLWDSVSFFIKWIRYWGHEASTFLIAINRIAELHFSGYYVIWCRYNNRIIILLVTLRDCIV